LVLVVYAVILSFFLPFYVMGIYNQAKKINKNLKDLINYWKKEQNVYIYIYDSLINFVKEVSKLWLRTI